MGVVVVVGVVGGNIGSGGGGRVIRFAYSCYRITNLGDVFSLFFCLIYLATCA